LSLFQPLLLQTLSQPIARTKEHYSQVSAANSHFLTNFFRLHLFHLAEVKSDALSPRDCFQAILDHFANFSAEHPFLDIGWGLSPSSLEIESRFHHVVNRVALIGFLLFPQVLGNFVVKDTE